MIIDMFRWRDRRREAIRAKDEIIAKAMAQLGTCKDEDLVYAAYARCACGAGLAHPKDLGSDGSWSCSAVLKAQGTYVPGEHHEYPFSYFPIVPEDVRNHATTRPGNP